MNREHENRVNGKVKYTQSDTIEIFMNCAFLYHIIAKQSSKSMIPAGFTIQEGLDLLDVVLIGHVTVGVFIMSLTMPCR